MQRLKCSSIPVSRNILADALGNETVINTAKVLGTERYYAGQYGTDVPESVTSAAGAIYFVSVRNKEIYRFNPSSGIEVISEKGMASFFDSVLSRAEASDGVFKAVGGFDADQQEFILSTTDELDRLTAPEPAPISNLVEPADVVADDFTFDFDVVDPPAPPDVVAETIADLQEQVDDLTTTVDNIDNLVADAFTAGETSGYEQGFAAGGGGDAAGYSDGFAAGFDDAVNQYDSDGDGEITANDFDSNVNIENFEQFDTDDDGVIDTTDFDNIVSQGFDSAIDFYDANDSGDINIQDFPDELVAAVDGAINQYIADNPPDAFTFADVEDLFATGGVSASQGQQLLDALLSANPSQSADINSDGSVSVADLLELLTEFGGAIDPFVVPNFITPPEEDAGNEDASQGGVPTQ